MEQHNVTHLEARIKEMGAGLANLADDKDLQELLTIIHKPGWTTPAEALFVAGIMDAMMAHTKTLVGLKQVLLAGSRAVSAK